MTSDRTRGHRTPAWGHRLRAAAPLLAIAGLLLAIAVFVPALWVYLSGRETIYEEPGQAPTMPMAIVFGAGLQPDGSPSRMLADRVDAAVALYEAGKVRRILMTGDNSRTAYDEVTAMKGRAVALGVPDQMVNLDYAGFRTYDSCYRARAIFGIGRAVLVTQRYHLPRALFLCRSVGIEAAGLAAGRDHYPRQQYYDLREFAARVVSWYEVYVARPGPRFLGDPVDLEQQNR